MVFLDPDAAAVEARERDGAGNTYGTRWQVGALKTVLREEAQRIGLWLDSTDLTAEQTIDRILADPASSLVRTKPTA